MIILEKVLREFGLDDTQRQIFTEIFTRDGVTVLELATITGIKRPTVHFHIEKLLALSLIKNGVHAGRRVLVAESVEVLGQFLKERKLQIEKVEAGWQRVLEETEKLESPARSGGVSVMTEEGMAAYRRYIELAFSYAEVYSIVNWKLASHLHEVRQELLFSVKNLQLIDSYQEVVIDTAGDAVSYIKKANAYQNLVVKSAQLDIKSDIAQVLVYDSTCVFVRGGLQCRIIVVQQPLIVDLLKALIAVTVG